MILTAENYYSQDANMEYMSASQFKAFSKCEAAALAELRGEYIPAISTAMLLGSYVDAWFAGEMSQFQSQHPEIFKRDGTLKSEYVKAQDIIGRMESDELFSLLMSGKKQVIVTGEIAGIPFKGKIDSLLDADTCNIIAERFPATRSAMGDVIAGAIVDQKCMKDILPVWSTDDCCKLPFVEVYGYDIQGAIYQALEGHNLPFILAVGTKENEPNLEAMYISNEDLKSAFYQVEDKAPRYQAIKEGREQPHRCGRCAYCRATKKLTGIINYRDLVDIDE